MAQDDFSTGTVELEEAEVKVDRPPLFTEERNSTYFSFSKSLTKSNFSRPIKWQN